MKIFGIEITRTDKKPGEDDTDPLARALAEEGITVDRKLLIDVELWLALQGVERYEIAYAVSAYKAFSSKAAPPQPEKGAQG